MSDTTSMNLHYPQHHGRLFINLMKLVSGLLVHECTVDAYMHAARIAFFLLPVTAKYTLPKNIAPVRNKGQKINA